LVETRHGTTMSETEIHLWPIRGTSSTADLLSDHDVMPTQGRMRMAPRPPTLPHPSVGQVLAAHGALQDNWDGQGAISPSLASIRTAQRFIEDLPARAVPTISASVEGGVLLEWATEAVGLILEIANSGVAEALVCWPNGEEVEGPLPAVKQSVLDALALLFDQP
jgi:hypothetical protein